MFVTFEGIEGSGKSTLAAAVARVLQSSGRDVVPSREPGGTPVGDAVRAIFLQPDLHIDAMTETLLINASRAQLVANVIEPALQRNADVLCDRFVHSTLAYQGYGRGLPLDLVRTICAAATKGREPDLTLLLDVPYETSLTRMRARGKSADRVEVEDAEFHARVRSGYLELARTQPRMITLDGTRSPEELLEAAMAALSAAMA